MLKEGDKAPSFERESDAGKTVKLSDFAGKRLVLYFYPKDNTPGCTRESIGFSEAIERFTAAGVSVVGVSRDSVKSHGNFRDKYSLKIPLLSDADLSLHHAFGAWGEKVMYGKKVEGSIRSTFLIGADGTIEKAWPSVKVDGHVEQVLAALGVAAGEAAPGKKVAAGEAAPAKKVAKKVAKKEAVKKPPPAKKAAKKR